VTGVLKQGAYRVELANGHRCIARTSGEARNRAAEYVCGDAVSLEFHPYDLSRARIVG
jgi:translation initiation factor IF-1